MLTIAALGRSSAILLAAAATTIGVALPAPAAGAGRPTVMPVAATWTPTLATSGTDGSVEQIRKVEQCGTTMYAVGRFSSIKQGSTTYTRNNAFSFSATTGTLRSWDPDVDGQVNAIALSADCSTAYLGGTFRSVNGTAVRNIAAVNTSNGHVRAAFAHSAGGKVNTVAKSGHHLLVGGNFPSINGSATGYLVSLNPKTGKDDGYVDLDISGKYVYTDQAGHPNRGNTTNVYNLSMSPNGRRLLAMGVFTSVGGHARRQIVMLDLGTSSATVDRWYSREFNRYCAVSFPFYLQDASWSPNGRRIYVVTTGFKPANGAGFHTSEDRAGLCDATAAFSSRSSRQTHKWINYTGCDSLYSTAADRGAVYVGGHQRWLDNPGPCDGWDGPGDRVDAPGMGGLHPRGGASILNGQGRDPDTGHFVNKYNKGRGIGATDMVLTAAGLWIASDNAQNVDACGRTETGAFRHGRTGLCFLPY